MAFDLAVALVVALDRRHVHRRRQVVDHRVQHGLHALVLEGAAAQHRHDLVGHGAGAQALLDFLFAQRLAGQVFLEQRLIGLGRLSTIFAPGFGLGLHVRRNVPILEAHALAGIIPDDGLHLDQIDHALEMILGAHRQLDRHGVAFQALDDLALHAQEVRAHAVHLVDEGQARHLVLVGLAPDRLGLRLHAADGVVHHDGAVQHAHGAFDLDGEIHVPRRVDDVDAVLGIVAGHALPERGGGGRGDGDAAFLFLFHPVHHGGAVVHLADLVSDACVEEDALGGGRLARVDMGADADIAVKLDARLASHGLFPCCVQMGEDGKPDRALPRRREAAARCVAYRAPALASPILRAARQAARGKAKERCTGWTKRAAKQKAPPEGGLMPAGGALTDG